MPSTSTNGASPTSSAAASRNGMSDSISPDAPRPIIVPAIGALHVTEASDHRYRDMFAEISAQADVLALCGDLTNFGRVADAEILADDLGACTSPVVAVLGNHDCECGKADEVAHILQEAGA